MGAPNGPRRAPSPTSEEEEEEQQKGAGLEIVGSLSGRTCAAALGHFAPPASPIASTWSAEWARRLPESSTAAAHCWRRAK